MKTSRSTDSQILAVLRQAVDLSRIYASPISRSGRLAFESQGTFAAQR